MRVLALLGLAAIAAAIPLQHDVHKRDVQDFVDDTLGNTVALVNGDGTLYGLLQGASDDLAALIGKKNKRDLQDILNGVTNDATALVNGDGTVAELLDHLLNNLGDTLGLEDVGTLLDADIQIGKKNKRDLQDILNGVTNDATALVNGDGTVTKLVDNLLHNLGTTLGVNNIGTLLDADINIGKRNKRDLQDILNSVTNDATALVNGDGTVTELVDNLLNNLSGTLGIDDIGTLLDANISIGKRTPGLINLDVDLLSGLRGLLEQLKDVLTNHGITDEAKSLLGQVQSDLSKLNINTKRDGGISLSAVVSLNQVVALVDSLLGQVNGLLSGLGL